mmetsp:Transcript_7557/g.21433  ORF Transcript_7557/g.21433 Transcript_7557/m.21433 type:complete len:481 (-) Transcript_7557:46-1488(-)
MRAAPQCPVCIDTIGANGGPASLPCGHNGCLECLKAIQQRRAECPLCRAEFSGSARLQVNRDLEALLHMAASQDEAQETAEWEVLPEARASTENSPPPDTEQSLVPVPTALPMEPAQVRDWFLRSLGPDGARLMSIQPPVWTPDSAASECGECGTPFRLTVPRHHCRLCGDIYCAACSSARLLMPPNFQQSKPQRCCKECAALLRPLQLVLAESCSPSAHPPVHDTFHHSVPRTWFNVPYPQSLEFEVFKCTNILRTLMGSSTWVAGEMQQSALRTAKALVVLSSAKAGLGWSVSFGSGLMVKRRDGGGWSAPAGISSLGFGWGLQGGAQVADLVLALRTDAAVESFCKSMIGDIMGGLGLALGRYGLQGTADVISTYSVCQSRGVYAGVSVEGMFFFSRPEANHAFYGQALSTRQLVHGEVPPPFLACKPLYDMLDKMARELPPPLDLPSISRTVVRRLPGRVEAPLLQDGVAAAIATG